MPFPQCYEVIKTYPVMNLVHTKVDVLWLFIQMFKNNLALLQNLCAIFYTSKLQNYSFQQTPPEGTFSEEMKNVIALVFFFLSLPNCVSILHYTLYSLPFWHSQLPFGALWRSRLASRCNRHQLPKPGLLMSHIAAVCPQAHRTSSYAASFQTAGGRGEKCVWSITYKNNLASKTSCPIEHNNQWHSGMSASVSAGSSCYPLGSWGKWRQVHTALVWRQGNAPRHFNSGRKSLC